MTDKNPRDRSPKYCIGYMDKGEFHHEIFDGKVALRNKLKEIRRKDISFVIKGRLMPIRVEERLTV